MLAGNCLPCKFHAHPEFVGSLIDWINRYLEASRLNGEAGRLQEAVTCAERALHVDEDCLGRDHALYLETLQILEKCKSRV